MDQKAVLYVCESWLLTAPLFRYLQVDVNLFHAF